MYSIQQQKTCVAQRRKNVTTVLSIRPSLTFLLSVGQTKQWKVRFLQPRAWVNLIGPALQELVHSTSNRRLCVFAFFNVLPLSIYSTHQSQTAMRIHQKTKCEMRKVTMATTTTHNNSKDHHDHYRCTFYFFHYFQTC